METGLLKHSERPGNDLFNHDASVGGGQRYLQLGQPLDGFQGPQDPQHTEGLDGLDIPALVGPAAWEGGAGTQKQSGDTITFGTRGWVLSELPPARAWGGDGGPRARAWGSSHRRAAEGVLSPPKRVSFHALACQR